MCCPMDSGFPVTPAAPESDVPLHPKASQMFCLYFLGGLLHLALVLSRQKEGTAPVWFPDLTEGPCYFQGPEDRLVTGVTMLAPSLLCPPAWPYVWHPGWPQGLLK